ncbi:hypothetical protein KKD52_18370 [Myxococcota bacterium]|jgi:hypothetical protein|nr:hypothetical protein [Myxococcota bacterium]MBU1411040.1 hypothetical protein [Myxococcota bacterium]MBU1512321.1 hypothetical protein [Myxococcota bacterium]PKN25343.1 MAG: hypothetical protein CVU65_09115 [Deltaproteobacteria bacterium HGW-Deltaproteobacteria-22]
MRFQLESAVAKRQINDVKAPERNHPIHDAATVFAYRDEGDDWSVVITFDGVSESKSAQEETVQVARELAWELEVFCRDRKPRDIREFARWFSDSASNTVYEGKGATTISLLRFHHQSGAIDGLAVGDSPALLVVQNEDQLRAQVLTPLHVVVNDPSSITRQWRYGLPLEITVFQCDLPQPASKVYLVTMSDGYQKLSDQDTVRLMDDDVLDSTASDFFPFFTRVYPPEAILAKYRNLKPDLDGAVPFFRLISCPGVWEAMSEVYETADEKTRRNMAIVDFDVDLVYAYYKNPAHVSEMLGIPEEEIIQSCHPSLTWMRSADFNPAKDESDLEGYLREYVQATVFTQSFLEIVTDVRSTSFDRPSLQKRLLNFVDQLDPIADDFSIAMLEITVFPAATLQE